MKNVLKWTMASLIAFVAVLTFGPEIGYARGGRGGGGRGGGGRGGRGGGRGGGGGGRGGGSRGGSGRGRGGGKTGGKNKFKDASDYLEHLQREEAEYLRPGFQFGSRDESLVQERDRSRDQALADEREAGAAQRRAAQESTSHPY